MTGDGTAVWKNIFHVFKLLHLTINRIQNNRGLISAGGLQPVWFFCLQVDGPITGRDYTGGAYKRQFTVYVCPLVGLWATANENVHTM